MRRTYTSLFGRFAGRFGPGRCGLCGGVLGGRRRHWCSDRCVRFLYRLSGDAALLRAEVIQRDNHTCRACGRHDENLTPDVWNGEVLALPTEEFPAIYARHEYSWRVDHIVPIAEGGAQFDPANLQLLCPPCDRRKTSEDLSRIQGRPSPLGLRKLEEFT